MAQYEIKKTDGTAAGTAELADAVYGIEPNIPVIHQVIVCQDACLRQGTHATKNRHDVSGGGKKPYRQKGTGRARQGSTRAGQWKGGGVIFGPMPHSHAKRINNKMVKLAMRSVLSGKVADDDINTYLSFRNMPKVNVIGIGEACAGNLIDNAALVMTEDIAKQLEEVLA